MGQGIKEMMINKNKSIKVKNQNKENKDSMENYRHNKIKVK